MSNFPCKNCIVKPVCTKLCPKVLSRGYLTRQLYFHIKHELNCPDCGYTKGTTFNGNWMSIIECSECFSSFFPTTTSSQKLTIYRNGKRVVETLERIKEFATTFDFYINKLASYRRNI
jgi:hypothetical protein